MECLFIWILSAVLVALTTAGEEATEDVAAAEEPLFGVLDIVLIVALLGIAGWWLLKKKDESSKPVYTIQPTTLGSPTQQSGDNSFIKKLKTSGRSLVAFYGSQTGTGEEFAGRIAKEGIRYHLKGMVADPEEYDMGELVHMKDIPNSLAIFCLATYGEGDPTDNAMDFYEWLQNGDADLTGLNYAVFGLGNKTYEHYNAVGIYVDKRLEELGATRVWELGLGDDDANIEDDFITWKDKFWPAVCEYFGIESTGEEVSVRQYQLTEHPDINPERVYTGEVARLHSFKNQRPPFDMKNPYLAPVKVNRELNKGGERSCMHIEFDINGSKMRYDTGDHLAVYPENDAALVNKLGRLLDADLDTVFTLTNTDEDSSKKHPFPCPTTYRTALTYYVDITSNPRTHILKELSEYAKDPKEKEQLKLMSSTSQEGKQLYNQWIIQDNRNIIHILEDMPSVKPEIDHLCELLPRLQCRYYSISSSAKLYPTTVHVTAVKVEYTTATGRVNKGVCTCWLADKVPNTQVDSQVDSQADGQVDSKADSQVDSKADSQSDSQVNRPSLPLVPIFIRKSQFKLPTRVQTPIIMIGPGTGLAPFRGFIQERDLARKEGKPVGDTILYFGCRKKSEDFLYQEELEDYEKSGILKLHVAFSRDQPEKVYVTHLLKKNKDEVWRIIGENNGHLYICGDARTMARDVHEIVVQVVQEKGNMTQDQALAYVKKMEAQKRYSADVWS